MATGQCKVCKTSLKREINKRLARNDSYPSIIEWAKKKDFSVSKPTLGKHKAHITDPMTTLVDQARADPAIKRVTVSEFRQALIDIGFQRALADPDSVSIDHALKASAQEDARKDKHVDVLMVVANRVTERLEPPKPEALVGEYKEIPVGIEATG